MEKQIKCCNNCKQLWNSHSHQGGCSLNKWKGVIDIAKVLEENDCKDHTQL